MKYEILSILEDLKPGEDFAGSDNFIDEGLLDSFDIISLISIIEKEYDVEIDGLDIVADNFKDVESIVNLIKKSKTI